MCRLCGNITELSYEHTPPEAAFNSAPVVEMPSNYFLGNQEQPLAYLDKPKGRTNQRGAGGNTLCGPCNSKTGSWYASKFAEFSHGLMNMEQAANSADGVSSEIRFHPLNVLKQIVLMFLTSNGDEFHKKNPALVEFVQNRQSHKLPRHYKVFLALTDMNQLRGSRSSGVSGRIDFDSGSNFVYSEIAFPPVVMVMTFDSPRPDQKLTKINWFRHYDFDVAVKHPLSLMRLPIVSYLPADYRTEVEIRSGVAGISLD